MPGVMRSGDGGVAQRTNVHAAGRPRRLAAMGRHGDNEVGHLTRGELVVPRGLLSDRKLRARLADSFDRAGLPMDRYEVGSGANSRNPRTGMREFYGGGPGDPDNEGPGQAGAGSGGGNAGEGGGRDAGPNAGTTGPGGDVGRSGYGGGYGAHGSSVDGRDSPGGGDIAGSYGTFEDFIGVRDDDRTFGTIDTTGTLDEGGLAFSTNTPEPGLGAHIASGLATMLIPGGALLNSLGLLSPEALTRHPDEYRSAPSVMAADGGSDRTAPAHATPAGTAEVEAARDYTGIYTPPYRTHERYYLPPDPTVPQDGLYTPWPATRGLGAPRA